MGYVFQRQGQNGYAKELRLVRQVFTNKDDSTGTLYLVCSDITCDCNTITTSYKKRWQVEVFHKNLKSNAVLAKLPTQTQTQTLRTQNNHIFMSIYAVFKLECLSARTKLNAMALRFKLLTNATRSAFRKLRRMHATPAAA